jgi:hypothetical protein
LIPNESGSSNDTVITELNCTIHKICKKKAKCFDEDWWNQYDHQCCGKDKIKKDVKRVCNFTEDATFVVDDWLIRDDYYDECDCVLFKNCTAIVVPPEVVPPSGGGENCTFTC